MPTYYAIALRNGQWQYIYAGSNPESLYHEAAEMIQGQYFLPGDEGLPISSSAEQQLKTLRVVPSTIAREKYHVVFARARTEE